MVSKTATQQRLDASLKRIETCINNKIPLDMSLDYDLFSGELALKVGIARRSTLGKIQKPEHIETFLGSLAVAHALAVIVAEAPTDKRK